MLPTSVETAMAANRKGALDWPLLRRWWLPLLIGALAAAHACGMASWSHTSRFSSPSSRCRWRRCFAVWNERKRLRPQPPGGIAGGAVAFAIGGISTLIGLGGGTIGVPALTSSGVPFERALGTANAFGVIVSVTGRCGRDARWLVCRRPAPFSLGYVNVAAVLLLAPTLFFASKAGASLAQVIDRDRLRKVLALFVAVAAARLLWEVLA